MSTSSLRSIELYDELINEAKTENDFTNFVRYQSIAYRKLEQNDLTDYSIHIYQVVGQLDLVYKNQFVIYVLPKNDISYALSIDDQLDQTKALIKNKQTQDILFNTDNPDVTDSIDDDKYKDRAISFGISFLGFYYYGLFLNDSQTIEITLKDYNDNIIFESELDYEAIDYHPNTSNLLLGFSKDELEELLDLNTYVRPQLVKNVTIYLFIDILLGGFIYFILKRKSQK